MTQLELELTTEQPADAGMQRLGETTEFGLLLLQLLSVGGWTVDVRGAVGGGLLVTVAKGDVSIARSCEAVAEVASDIFKEAMGNRRYAEASARGQ